MSALGETGRKLAPRSPAPAPAGISAPTIAATRKTVSWKRKAFHFASIGATGLTVALAGLDRGTALAIFAVVAAVLGGVDLFRLASPSWNARFQRWFRPLLRDEERTKPTTSSWFLLGGLATLAWAPLPLAGLAFIYLAAGDPVASWVGVRHGRTRLPGGKSLEGSLALVGTCFVLGTAFLALTGSVPLGCAPAVALGGALAAALCEWLPGPGDDNFRVPIGAALALTGLAHVFSLTPVVQPVLAV